MGRPKGSKNKANESVTPAPQTEQKKVDNSSLDLQAPHSDDSVQFGFGQREELYSGYKQSDTDKEVAEETMSQFGYVNPGEQGTAVTETKETEEIQETEKPVEESTEVEELKEEITIETKDERTVPYGALKEEREKRKEKDSQVQQLIEDNKKLLDLVSKKEGEDLNDEYLDESQKQINDLKKQMKDLIDSKDREHKDKAISENEKKVDVVDKRLSDEGFPGLKKYGESIIRMRINDMYEKDPEFAKANDNLEGYAKIWKEEYPKMVDNFKARHEEDVIRDKEALKEGANLATSRTKPEGQEKKAGTRADTFSEYKKLREASNVF